tara:strand:- start:185 stop:376 length:192 start_codon:yes stop_codon:yes gene_type:complete
MSEEFGQVSNIYRLRKILERAVEEKFKDDAEITDGGTSLNGKQADFVFNLHEDRFSVNINKLK